MIDPWRLLAALALGLAALAEPAHGAGADIGTPPAALPATADGAEPARRPVSAEAPRRVVVPRTRGRLTARELGLVINSADPYSVEVGEFYARLRGLDPSQVLRVVLPVERSLGADGFKRLVEQIEAHFSSGIQALALAWNKPYAVGCQSITGALALGLDSGLCERSCAPTPTSAYFNSPSIRPWSELRMRPAMLLAAADIPAARSLIRRGIAADGSLGLRGAPPAQAHFVVTGDAARSVRARLYPAPGLLRRYGVTVAVDRDGTPRDARRVLLYLTGLAEVPGLERLDFVPGALADHVTSFGGQLEGGSGQMSARAWIDGGATASYGTVSEPCNHLQKFPHPQVLLLHYLQGSTALEAYWKSVAWPSQGLFVGEPLAAPFARR
jgi:uncharacterized protein (TIGR03790 family)